MEKHCLVCRKLLVGRQRKFCSQFCKHTTTNNKHQNYVAQQRRGYDRRAKLIDLKGGRCEICSYNRNNAALSFHHVEPSLKAFQIDLRKCSNSSWNKLIEEANKCKLLCL